MERDISGRRSTCPICGNSEFIEFLVLCSDGLYRHEECKSEDDGLKEFEEEMEAEMGDFYYDNPQFPGSPYTKKKIIPIEKKD